MGHGVEGRNRAGGIDAATAREVAATMQALSGPSRVRILARLREAPCEVTALAAAVGMEQSAVSHQPRLLPHLHLVAGERRGRRVVYALHDDHVAVLLDEAAHHAAQVGLSVDAPARADGA